MEDDYRTKDGIHARRASGSSVATGITTLRSLAIHSTCLACRRKWLPFICAAVVRRQEYASMSIAQPPTASEMLIFNWSEDLLGLHDASVGTSDACWIQAVQSLPSSTCRSVCSIVGMQAEGQHVQRGPMSFLVCWCFRSFLFTAALLPKESMWQ